ncbi:TDP-N-acetylfucosamine:lipid II N-acetylfucosaminyltransferase [Lachnospiraceae bacterium 54-11]
MRFFRLYNPKKIKNKIVHLMMVEKFTESYVRTINKLFPIDENDFVIYGGPVHKGIELHCLKEKNVYTIMNGYLFKRPKYKNFLLKHKKIIIHGLFESGIIDNWSSDVELLEKSYIVLFGAYSSAEKVNDIKYFKIIQNAAGIVNLLKAENKLVEELYHPKGKLFNATYSYVFEYPDRVIKKDERENILKIQVGNSATKSIEHLKVIDLISRFKDENIEVYVPLAYGDGEYADIVEDYGKKKLGDKFIAVREFVPEEQFIQFVSTMDIAIFPIQQQQAMGNININIYFGNCVYLSENTVMAEFYENEIGCKIKWVEDIERMDFESFKNWEEEDGKNNSSKITNFYNIDNFKNKWGFVFDFPD